MSTVLSCIPVFFTNSIIGYLFFICFVGFLVYSILKI